MIPLSARQFIDSIGVNAHLDFPVDGYRDLKKVIAAIKYLNVFRLRDCPQNPANLGATGLWQQVANATGAKFLVYMPEASEADMRRCLGYVTTLANQGIVNMIEGGNEEDDPYAARLGNSLQAAAKFQQEVSALGNSLGIPVVNMSFGQGWDKAVSGNYGTMGDLSEFCDFGNAHIYYMDAWPPRPTLDTIIGYAKLAAKSRMVVITETGWTTPPMLPNPQCLPEVFQAKYMLMALLHAYALGVPYTYIYELMDHKTGTADPEDNYGIFRSDGTPKPAAQGLRSLIQILEQSVVPSKLMPLNLTITGGAANDYSYLFQLDEDGNSYALAVWNEQRIFDPVTHAWSPAVDREITVSLDKTFDAVLYDPLHDVDGASPILYTSKKAVSFKIKNYPLILKIHNSPLGTN